MLITVPLDKLIKILLKTNPNIIKHEVDSKKYYALNNSGVQIISSENLKVSQNELKGNYHCEIIAYAIHELLKNADGFVLLDDIVTCLSKSIIPCKEEIPY